VLLARRSDASDAVRCGQILDRIDKQVKIHGYRIEPNEIATALEFGIEIALRVLFDNPTVGETSSVIERLIFAKLDDAEARVAQEPASDVHAPGD
jgi:hypothetical protein